VAGVPRSTLRYEVGVSGISAPKVQAVVLRRREANGTARVVHRLAGPGATSAAGSATLSAKDRDALAAGRVVLTVVTTGAGLVEGRLVAHD
jgi:hypothetical protein